MRLRKLKHFQYYRNFLIVEPQKAEEKEKIISEDFQIAFDHMLREIKNAKKLKWKTTSKEAATKSVTILYNIITI